MNITKRLIFILLIVLVTSGVIAQEKQKNLMEAYIGKWSGKATIQNINMFGGWGSGGSLGIHRTIRELWEVKLNIKFLHPLDDPLAVEEYEKVGIPVDYLKNLKNMLMLVPSLRITGNAGISGFSENTHLTKEYCEECKGKDGTQKKDFSEIFIPVSGDVILAENKINFGFGDLPKEYDVGLSYWFSSENVKLVEPNRIVLNYKSFEENVIDQNFTGELYRIELLKKTFPKDIKPNEPIKTDKKTQLEITMPSKDVINVAQNTEAVIRSESLMEIMKGKIHGLIKKLKPKTKYEIHMPTSAVSVRGTEYVLDVADDITAVVVLDGEVEFSDKQSRKTVLVKKNQQSIIRDGGLPSEPVNINPDQIPRWWE